MRIKPRRLRGYVNYGAIPTNEYKPATVEQTPETHISGMEESGPEQELNANEARLELPVKVPQPRRRFRQARTGKQKRSGTSLGWRTNRASQRDTGFDNNR